MESARQEYCTIPLSQGQTAIVDSTDYERLSEHKWFAIWSRSTRSFYAGRNASRPGNSGKQTTISMHREICRSVRGVEVDHKNHNTLDNRRENLRSATRAQNQWNRGRPSHNKSGFKGVTFRMAIGRWVARLYANKKAYYLGEFNTPAAAHAAYIAAAEIVHGEFFCVSR